jgi:hypothetical protein
MPNLRGLDMLLVDDLFDMHGGYVLNFSDRTFAAFFRDELNLNIDDPAYSKEGGSKAKRLRYFLQTADKPTVVKTLNALWEYREAFRARNKQDEKLVDAHARFSELINRLKGGPSAKADKDAGRPTVPKAKFAQLNATLLTLASLDPHPRGYAFEKYCRLNRSMQHKH